MGFRRRISFSYGEKRGIVSASGMRRQIGQHVAQHGRPIGQN
jgi:hypothetical protein